MRYKPKGHWVMLGISITTWLTASMVALSAKNGDLPENNQFAVTKLNFAPIGHGNPNPEKPVFAISAAYETSQTLNGQDDTAIDQPPAALPALVGIVAGRKKSLAMLKGQDGITQNFQIGDMIDGWRLSDISADSVTVSTANLTQKITIEYGPASVENTDSPFATN